MCYSLSNTLKGSDYSIRFKIDVPIDINTRPLYYISAFSLPAIPVISNDKPNELQQYRWGLIPHWIKSQNEAEAIRTKTFNARSETIFDKPSYKFAAIHKRCLIPVDGFYEWHEQNMKKYPFYVTKVNNEPFALAGIWDIWIDNDTGTILKSFSIVTTPANNFLAKIHNQKKRMPLILERKFENEWLSNDTDRNRLVELLTQYGSDDLKAYPVSKMIVKRGIDTNVPNAQKEQYYSELKI